jgi:hypothetical protein
MSPDPSGGQVFPPPRPLTDVQILVSAVSGAEPLLYVETGLLEAAVRAAARWPGLARLRAQPEAPQ